jgi:hypothetical protein
MAHIGAVWRIALTLPQTTVANRFGASSFGVDKKILAIREPGG